MKIDTIPLFSATSETFRSEMDKFLRWKSFHAGQEIINREDKNSDLLFVHKGKVRIVIYTLSGREVTLDDIEAGGFSAKWPRLTKNRVQRPLLPWNLRKLLFCRRNGLKRG